MENPVIRRFMDYVEQEIMSCCNQDQQKCCGGGQEVKSCTEGAKKCCGGGQEVKSCTEGAKKCCGGGQEVKSCTEGAKKCCGGGQEVKSCTEGAKKCCGGGQEVKSCTEGAKKCCGGGQKVKSCTEGAKKCCGGGQEVKSCTEGAKKCCGGGQEIKSCPEGAKKCCGGEFDIHASVQQYYGKEIKTQQDLRTSVCTETGSKLAKHVREAFADVHEEVTIKYYGCGPVIPEAVEGCSVLDLGSGSGRDCFAMSKLVGQTGHVIGIDMTDEQLAVSRKYIDYHTEKFSYSKPNVEFIFGYMEKLHEAGLKENTFDIIISNCVVNLSPDKLSVLKEAYRVLKEGGELYFSDVYSDTHLSDAVRQDRILWGECISGALHWEEFYQHVAEVGFSRPFLVTAKMVDTSQFADHLGEAKFVSATFRLFKLPQTKLSTSHVTYNGNILGCLDQLQFDYAIAFKKDIDTVVDGEIATILDCSRFRKFFQIVNADNEIPQTKDVKINPFEYASAFVTCGNKSCC